MGLAGDLEDGDMSQWDAYLPWNFQVQSAAMDGHPLGFREAVFS